MREDKAINKKARPVRVSLLVKNHTIKATIPAGMKKIKAPTM